MGRGWRLIIAFCLAAIPGSGCSSARVEVTHAQPIPTANTTETVTQLPSLAPAIENAMPSVVFIYKENGKAAGGQPSFECGSGVILGADGYILTNRHVVSDASSVWVTLYDRRSYQAQVIYPDTLMDLAVVKIAASGLPAASIGDADKLKVGDYVIALGNPLGMTQTDGISTATSGIVSRRDYSFVLQGVPYYDVIQTDAAINTGNSGGPLINLEGEVIGINSAHALFAQNIGFAISMNTAKHVFDDLVKLGRVDRPYIGIIVEDSKPQFLAATINAEKRIIITSVGDGTPAHSAGLRTNDIIIRINDREVNSVADLARTIWRMEAGDAIRITCLRGGETTDFTVVAITRPDNKPLTEL